ncbi:hypothetical protein GCM10010168_56710 [Actinoplanes ianthinogenes]|uniref:Uncharacterized protein n=1 Tax=Actinoplanes ianthinogenes TaxID=122358 RepID=A0ABN6CP50_9ACTN|nr:hypothetical protein [Actinoplanes ianthinogenes]BCJ45909.1 hypothetical protein Aiant_65660 [Actinoplanes ianthinogenes]GGR31201.1 hypothetical protein GCM10010168_56710 [Actinoplanes ianthinogenes]
MGTPSRLIGTSLLAMTSFLLVPSLLDLIAGEGYVTIVDGNPQPDPAAGTGPIRLALIGVIWLVSLIGAIRGGAIRVRAMPVLLGWVVAPAALAGLRTMLGTVPWVDRLLDAVLLALVLAVQAAALLSPEAKRTRVWPAAVATLAGLALTFGIVVWNPYRAPVIHTGPGIEGAVAVAWPAGQHPVIVTIGGVRYCEDDRCATFRGVTGSPAAVQGYSTVSIGADGTVVKAALSGGTDTGGPFVQYARCDREGCRTAYFPVRASADDELDLYGRIEVAGAAAPDGSLWFLLAVPQPGGRHRFTMVHCAIACVHPDRYPIGAADQPADDGYRDGMRAQLRIGADGRPHAGFWVGRSILELTCDPDTCAHPRQDKRPGGDPEAVWALTGRGTVVHSGGKLSDGRQTWQLSESGSGSVAVDEQATYAAAGEEVWRCADVDCDAVSLGTPARGLIAVGGDGRLLVIRDDRVLLVDKPYEMPSSRA